MLFKPLLDGDYGTLVRLWRGVGPVKDADLLEEVDGDATALSLGDLSAKPIEESLNILPGDIRAGWVGEDGFESLAVAALHGPIVPRSGTGIGPDA